MIKNSSREILLSKTLNNFGIFEPMLICSLINEINKTEILDKSSDSFIEDIIYLYFLKIMFNDRLLQNSFHPDKNEFFQIVYSYKLSLDKLLTKNEREYIKFNKCLGFEKNKKYKNIIEKRKMKRDDFSFIPSLEKINKFQLYSSILIWIVIYLLIFLFNFI